MNRPFFHESENDATKNETKARVMVFQGGLQKKYESVDQSCVSRPFFHESENDATKHETKARVMVLQGSLQEKKNLWTRVA